MDREEVREAVDDAGSSLIDAACRWASADYGDIEQIHADAELLDAVHRYESIVGSRGLLDEH